MARRKRPIGSLEAGQSFDPFGWGKLTWGELEAQFDPATVTRGRDYQREGRVKKLVISADGDLLATVQGTKSYATRVSLDANGEQLAIESVCTCFVGFQCKHAIATVAQYLEALAANGEVPIASAGDSRWARVEEVGDDLGVDDDEEEEPARPRARRTTKSQPAPAGANAASWDDQVERHLKAKSQGDLVVLIMALIRQFPAVAEQFRDQLAVRAGNTQQLIDKARSEVRAATAEPGSNRYYRDGGFTPDFEQVTARFEQLLKLGLADEVVALGRDFIERGQEILELSDDEGETIDAFGEAIPIIFEALLQSSLSGPERLLFAIDADMNDQYDAVSSATSIVLDAPTTPADWSAVADTLKRRLTPGSDRANRKGVDDQRSYHRAAIASWIAQALDKAGRNSELLNLLEAEARQNASYERLVTYLIELSRLDDAVRWAEEGIAATGDSAPGIADHLARSLCEIARRRGQWDLVAAHAARPFFDNATVGNLADLIKAAEQVKVGEPVRVMALQYLETGVGPFHWLKSPPAPVAPPPAPTAGKKRSRRLVPPAPAPTSTSAPPDRLAIDPAWPLPVPDYFIHLMARYHRSDSAPRPRFDILLELAIADRRHEDVLRWFAKLRDEGEGHNRYYGAMPYADRVAEAVAGTYPEQAIEIYLEALNKRLPQPELAAYEAATAYLRKLRPVYASLDRAGDWDALVASIRTTYKNRPRFMELLDRLDNRPVVATLPPKKPR